MEALEGKYARWYDQGYDFAGRSRERRAGRRRGSEEEEGERGWLGKRADGTLSLTNVYGDACVIESSFLGASRFYEFAMGVEGRVGRTRRRKQNSSRALNRREGTSVSDPLAVLLHRI